MISLFRRLSKLTVLGIETSFDDTSAALVTSTGEILALKTHSQTHLHNRTGGVVPPIAQQLHEKHIDSVVCDVFKKASMDINDVNAVATTVMPGLALSLKVGLAYTKDLIESSKKPFIAIHHMRAHALVIRMVESIHFPYLTLLISGGHCILCFVKDVDDFLLLGESNDIAPGVLLDKVARDLGLYAHPRFAEYSGGRSLDIISCESRESLIDVKLIPIKTGGRNCNFSFSGLLSSHMRLIQRNKEKEKTDEYGVLTNAADIAKHCLRDVSLHLMHKTSRAMMFLKQNDFFRESQPKLVVSGGVAANSLIRKDLEKVCQFRGFSLHVPPPSLCTDNAAMIAWNGIERLQHVPSCFSDASTIRFEPRYPIGRSVIDEIASSRIQLRANYKRLIGEHPSQQKQFIK